MKSVTSKFIALTLIILIFLCILSESKLNSVIIIRESVAPTIPKNLIADYVTGNIIILKWSASTGNMGVAGYEIYMGNKLLGTTNTKNYQVNGLTSETTYTFTVKAKDTAGNRSVGASLIRTTDGIN